MSGIGVQTGRMTDETRPLSGRTAVVAGATRGAGRAIARELGAPGAFVWCTGRSSTDAPSDYGRPETIEGTLELVRAEGGDGEAVVCDHLVADDVAELAERIGARRSTSTSSWATSGERPTSPGVSRSGAPTRSGACDSSRPDSSAI